MARDKLDLKQVAPPSDMEAHWFSYAPSGPLPGRHGPHDVDPVRMGMSYPPQNPKVRKDLLAYLYARKVRMPSRSTVKKRPEQSASAPSFAQSTSLRRVASESPERTMLPKGNGINQRSKQKLGLPLLGAQSRLEGASEAEVQRQSEILRQNSRCLGFDLAKREVEDLAELSLYHNKMTRRHVAGKQASKPALQQLKELKQQCLVEKERDDARQQMPKKPTMLSLSTQTLRQPPRAEGPLSAGSGQASPHRLRHIARQLTESPMGPCRLQLMARATGINVVTGGLRPEALGQV